MLFFLTLNPTIFNSYNNRMPKVIIILYDNYELLEKKSLIWLGEISQLTSTLNYNTQALETATTIYNSLQCLLDIQVSRYLSLVANLKVEI